MHVLVIEDDRRMASLLALALKEEGSQVTICHDGNEGLSAALRPEFDVIVLDLMLPGLDGFHVAQRLRKRGRQTPVLMLTARDAPADVIKGLDIGADDYVTKPFSLDVLLARVRAAARRGPASHRAILRAGGLSLNTANREVRLDGECISLTRTEFAILELLFRKRDHVVTRSVLLTEVWGHYSDIENNTLDAFMKLLRSKIEPDSTRRLIHTVRGVGYILRTAPE
jgi:DNA-binding response OmpR family regulator